MLKSMTGYGRAQRLFEKRDILVEIKSVNHRYFEFSARTPRAYSYLDERLKALTGEAVFRGKTEVSVNIFTTGGQDAQVTLHMDLARAYVDALREAGQTLGLRDDLSVSHLTRFGDLFQVSREQEADEVWREVRETALEAVERFLAMRVAEGAKMQADISSRLDGIESAVGKVEEQSPRTQAAYRERLYQKLSQLLETRSVDEQRVLTEVAVFADKIAVDEETVRLRSHIGQFRALLKSREPAGRKLDFLLQEMNREVNTIGSKCQDIEITNTVLEMKAELEKIREQVQNIE